MSWPNVSTLDPLKVGFLSPGFAQVNSTQNQVRASTLTALGGMNAELAASSANGRQAVVSQATVINLMVEGLLVQRVQQSAKGYVGAGSHQARLLTGTLADGQKIYFFEGAPQGAGTYRRLLRDANGNLIGDASAAERRLRDLIRYEALDLSRLPSLRPSQPASAHSTDSFRNTWFYFILDNPNQRVFYLGRVHDWFTRVVVDSGTVGPQPASFVVKSSLTGGDGSITKFNPPNLAIRVDSGMRARWGTALQVGTDLSNAPLDKQLEYAKAGDPIMDLISIQTFADGNYAGYRAEISAQSNKPLRLKSVARDALLMGGSVTWRRIWLDPKTMQRRSVEFTLVMKSETSVEAGFSTQPRPLDAKAEIELQMRVIDPSLQSLSVRQVQNLAAQAASWAGDLGLLVSKAYATETNKVEVQTKNGGDRARARLITTQKLAFGTPVWDLVPSAQGKNFGHPALDLANRVHLLLRENGKLSKGEFVRTYQEAQDRLGSLWASGTPTQRQGWALRLTNRLNINFGLPDVESLNAGRFSITPMTHKESTYRQSFLG